MEIRLQSHRSWTTTLYLAPISAKGWFTAWSGKHSSYKHGFVVRFLWLGWVVRWGYVLSNQQKRDQIRQFVRAAQIAAGKWDDLACDFDLMDELGLDDLGL